MDILHTDNLLKYIESRLIPDIKNKKELGEVFTPMGLVNEMLDKLPKSVWRKTELKWLDPSAGIGNFPVAIYTRLMEGLKRSLPDEEERRRHILENMIYMVEINPTNIIAINNIFIASNYKLNVFEGSFLDYDPNISFDIIVGNPPFQETNDEGVRSALNCNLWSVFINISFNSLLKKNGYLLFITPYSWMATTFKYKDVFNKNHIMYLNIEECKKWFKGVGSTFSYYLIKKTDIMRATKVVCRYQGKIYRSDVMMRELSRVPLLLTENSISVVRKFYDNDIQKVSFKHSGEITRKSINYIMTDIYRYPVRSSVSHPNSYSRPKHSLSDMKKILLCMSGHPYPLFDDGNQGMTNLQFYLLTDNEKYVDVLNSNLYRFVFKLCRWSGFQSISTYVDIPYITELVSNEHIYSIFNLTESEIELVEEVLRISY